MKRISLGHNRFAVVDDSDIELLSSLSWRIDGKGYAVAQVQKNKIRKTILMHRLILQAPKELQVDHINHNKLDNRRSNLRLCASSENHMNRKKTPSGIWWDGKRRKWGSQIKKDGRHFFLGRFSKKIDATRSYLEARKSMFGSFA